MNKTSKHNLLSLILTRDRVWKDPNRSLNCVEAQGERGMKEVQALSRMKGNPPKL